MVAAFPEGSFTEEDTIAALDSVTLDHDPPEIIDETRCALQVVYGSLTQPRFR